MRLALILTLTATAMAGAAAASPEDRYGPPAESAHARAPGAVESTRAPAAPYSGPFLRWSGKAAVQPLSVSPASPTPAPPAAYERPMRVASLPERREAPMASAYAPAPTPYQMIRRQPVAASPRPAPTAYPIPRTSPPSPAPQPLAKAPQPAAPAAVASAAPARAGADAPSRARYYSLHREYGDTPDHIDLPAARPPVLIGPSDGAGASSADEQSATPSKAAKSAASGNSPPF